MMMRKAYSCGVEEIRLDRGFPQRHNYMPSSSSSLSPYTEIYSLSPNPGPLPLGDSRPLSLSLPPLLLPGLAMINPLPNSPLPSTFPAPPSTLLTPITHATSPLGTHFPTNP